MAKMIYDHLLIERLLRTVPEIEQEYGEMADEWANNHLTDEDIQELEEIRILHNLPERDYHIPGLTIVFENILVPFIVSLSEQKHGHNRLEEVMNWLEELASEENNQTRNLVALACESLLTTYESKLKYIHPYMGDRLKAICRMQLPWYKLRQETHQLFAQ